MTLPPPNRAPPPDPTPAVGRVVQGRYRVLAPLGEGGMGVVYRAEQVGLGRTVAIKFLHSAIARDPQFVKRFEVEAQAMSRLSHPNCVAVLDFGIDGPPYLVMDLVEGESLRSVLAGGRLDPERSVSIARQVLAGLSHAHGHSVIHRDIKPENILLDRRVGEGDHVRLVDFGLAKLRDNTRFVTVGLALGTPQYMAPEQMREGPVDQRVDIYTVGLVLYEMLTGVRAFDGVDLATVLMKQHQVDPAPFSEVAPGVAISSRLEAVVRRALAKSPDARFASAAEMSSALQGAVSSAFQHAATMLHAGEKERPSLRPTPFPARAANRERIGLLVGKRLAVMVAAARKQRERIGLLVVPGVRRVIAAVAEQCRRKLPELPAVLAKHRWIAVGSAAGLLLGAVLVATSGGTRVESPHPRPAEKTVPVASAPEPPRPSVPLPPPPPVTPKLAAIEAFLARGERERAIALVRELQSAEPSDPDYSAMQARLAFEQRRWSEALTAWSATIRLDETRRSDPVFINGTIDSLQSESSARAAEDLLRLVGDSAKPYLNGAATSHPVPRVRGRVRALLKTWERRPASASR
jgi:hypothetical protein